MFEKILFATTATSACDHAAHVAFDLAKKYKSEFHLFHVFGLPSQVALETERRSPCQSPP